MRGEGEQRTHTRLVAISMDNGIAEAEHSVSINGIDSPPSLPPLHPPSPPHPIDPNTLVANAFNTSALCP